MSPDRSGAAGPALRERVLASLRGSLPSSSVTDWRIAGAPPEQAARLRAHFPARPVPAAVLMPIVDHPHGLTVLLTQRAEQLKNHAGQVSFPGGRIEPGDRGPLDAALRETHEEIGLDAGRVHVIGYLPDHLIISGFRVTPVVGFVDPGFALRLDPCEVDATFEVPLDFLFDVQNHRSRLRRIGDEDVPVYDIPYEGHHIWGATAGMLMTLYQLVTGGSR
ncbi:MAG TPA: CoA pyrophosphatase [Steroidobacteraceae bacterium]|nr:CoA pyrophosphatase [Steroidobacteraceae bacterium]